MGKGQMLLHMYEKAGITEEGESGQAVNAGQPRRGIFPIRPEMSAGRLLGSGARKRTECLGSPL